MGRGQQGIAQGMQSIGAMIVGMDVKDVPLARHFRMGCLKTK
jgi:hypothetical protein